MSSFTDRMIQRMNELEVTQADVMRGTGAGKATVSGWFNGTSETSSRYIEKLAQVLSTSTAYLLSGIHHESQKNSEVDFSSIVKLGYAPVLSWSQITEDRADMEAIKLNSEMLPLVPGAGDGSFYLSVPGLSNAPYFAEGEKICIDPNYTFDQIETGEMVVVKCGEKATFKALIVETDGYYLKSLNPEWDNGVIKVKSDYVLLGKYVGSFKPAVKFQL